MLCSGLTDTRFQAKIGVEACAEQRVWDFDREMLERPTPVNDDSIDSFSDCAPRK
jgi:hypothetical protein